MSKDLKAKLLGALMFVSGIFGIIPVLLVSGYIFITKKAEPTLKKISIVTIIICTLVTVINILFNYINVFAGELWVARFVSTMVFIQNVALIVFAIIALIALKSDDNPKIENDTEL